MTTTVLRLNDASRLGCAGRGLQLDLDVLHVGELHAKAVNASAVGAEVHLGEALGRDLLELLELLLGGAPFLRGEEAVSELRGQGLGDVAMRASSVVPGAAVNSNRARVETIGPSGRDAEPERAEGGFAFRGAAPRCGRNPTLWWKRLRKPGWHELLMPSGR
ncbi:hypothetical protein RBH85_34675 [Streptomyces rochei]|nr:hypothetical protein [Streptomyces rochei]WMI61328.1 hypothetical protein RBH85_34675 [Streptomyces rochei]